MQEKNILWFKALKEIVFPELTSAQYKSMWRSLHEYYSLGLSRFSEKYGQIGHIYKML